jgi:hypothetical protein
VLVHARKLSSLGFVVMIVSPSSAQFVVVAVLLRLSGLYDDVAFVAALRYNFVPSALLRLMVDPMVKRPDDDSGPSIGTPSGECKRMRKVN